MRRDILTKKEAAGIGIASATYNIVGLPPVTLGRGRTGSDGAKDVRTRASVASGLGLLWFLSVALVLATLLPILDSDAW